MMKPHHPSASNSPQWLDELCAALKSSRQSPIHDRTGHKKWLQHQLGVCASHQVFHRFIPAALGGAGWSEPEIVTGYLALSKSCLTTTFVVTQWAAATRRLVASDNLTLVQKLVPDLLSGQALTTVGISHLTTSRQHLGAPAVRAIRDPEKAGYIVNGTSSWVTAAALAKHIVMGAVTDDGNQILFALPTSSPGVEIGEPQSLIALDASLTGPVHCHDVFVSDEFLIAGPCPNVMQTGTHSGSGGLQTSTLAIGHAAAPIDYLESQSLNRPNLVDVASSLRSSWQDLVDHLMNAASGTPDLAQEELRSRANSLVLRASQAALVAAKGAGYSAGHPVGRWCQEALFFLVWSCPQSVQQANLCELATAQFE